MVKKVSVLDPKEGYNITAFDYEKKASYWNSFEKENLIPLLGEVKNKKILDVGAGTGRLSIALNHKGADVTALDISEEMLKILHKKCPTITTCLGEAESIPFPDNSFDIVLATFLIVHLKDPRRFFDEAYRVLKPGGLLVVTNINQRKAPAVKTAQGYVEIKSYYHRSEAIINLLEELAFSILHNQFIKEGEVWVNQIIVAEK